MQNSWGPSYHNRDTKVLQIQNTHTYAIVCISRGVLSEKYIFSFYVFTNKNAHFARTKSQKRYVTINDCTVCIKIRICVDVLYRILAWPNTAIAAQCGHWAPTTYKTENTPYQILAFLLVPTDIFIELPRHGSPIFRLRGSSRFVLNNIDQNPQKNN